MFAEFVSPIGERVVVNPHHVSLVETCTVEGCIALWVQGLKDSIFAVGSFDEVMTTLVQAALSSHLNVTAKLIGPPMQENRSIIR